ncbi:MAG: V-type ATP synthase subunit E family protein [Methanolinea sp.]|jgi:V/A-type H+-transporting ATPase subunit E|nr:V-type ATP synthase subunit E family protein [Methanolinea sp.]
MTYEDLIQSMEAGALEKIAEIQSNAGRQSEGIIRDAEEKAKKIRDEFLDRARATVADQRNRLLYKTRLDERSADIAAKDEILNAVYSRAAAYLGEIREKNDYRSLFARLLSESVKEMGEDVVVLHVDPRDEALCREVVPQMKGTFTIVPDIRTWGGVVVSSPDGQVRIHNTLESRLERAKVLTKREICRILFGE